jgi:branched-chain amino acid transport system substrate-binding protein
MSFYSLNRRALLGAGAAIALLGMAPAAQAQEIKFGLVAALSGQSARAGEAITRGLTVAVEEINAKGGILGGRKIVLLRRDDESNPSKGLIAARELIQREKVAALFGGLDTPVSLAIVPLANAEKVPFMGTWAAGTPITRNGGNPNFVFRVSAVDEIVDEAIVKYSVRHYGAKNSGMILVNNPWGESNEQGLKKALAAANMKFAGVEKFEGNELDVVPQLARLKNSGADVLYLVGNVGPSAQVVKSLDKMAWKVPVVSHWGPAGGRFTELAGPSAATVHFVQTYSFFGDLSPRGKQVLDMLLKKYPDYKGPGDITPAVGVANAYDAAHLVALAIEKAGSTDGDKVREGFYKIENYDGLIKKFARPFTPQNHDAVTAEDYVWTQFINDQIIPIKH